MSKALPCNTIREKYTQQVTAQALPGPAKGRQDAGPGGSCGFPLKGPLNLDYL